MQVTTNFNDASATVDYDFGETLEDSTNLFGEKVVHDRFVASAKIALQAFMSRLLKKGASEKDIAKAVEAEFSLEGRRQGKSKAEKAADLFSGMTDEEKAAFKELLKAG